MAYYLGYKKDGELHPIDLNIDNANDILSIVNFTCDFKNEDQLIEYLYSENLVREENIELTYLIQKGRKESKTYNELPNIKRIFYYCSSSNFDVEKIRKYLEGNTNNTTLIKYLLANLLKKYGIGENIKNFLMDNIESSSRRTYLISVLGTLLSNSSIISLNCKLQNLIDSFQNDSSFIEMQINLFVDFILSDNDSLVYIYRLLKRHLRFPKVLEIDDLLKLEFEIGGYRLNGFETRNYIDRFINHYIFNGQSINSRNLVDLGSMIQDYKDYILELELQNYKSPSENSEEYDELDEFLEEDDFARCDTTSESAGIKLRPTDSTT